MGGDHVSARRQAQGAQRGIETAEVRHVDAGDVFEAAFVVAVAAHPERSAALGQGVGVMQEQLLPLRRNALRGVAGIAATEAGDGAGVGVAVGDGTGFGVGNGVWGAVGVGGAGGMGMDSE